MNRRTFLGVIPAAAGISMLVAGPVKLPTIIPIIECLDDAPTSGPAIWAIGRRYDIGLELFVAVLDRKVIWTIPGSSLGPEESPKAAWIWATTLDKAMADVGRVLGGMGLSGPSGHR